MKFVPGLHRLVPAMHSFLRAATPAALAAFALAAGATAAQADPYGACCLASGSCEIQFNFQCVDAGESYQGDFTSCTPNPCPQPTTTTTAPEATTTTEEPTTTTLPATTTTTFLETTTTTDTTSTTMYVKGACCAGTGCYEVTQSLCEGEYLGTWVGDATSCDSPGICVNCGDGCLQYGESCDDGDTSNGDGCDSKCQVEQCFKCYEGGQKSVGSPRHVVPNCYGPSVCYEDQCGVCGDGATGPGEQCDDGNTAAGDCCDGNCQYEPSGSDCSDDVFCDGVETCNGEGICLTPEVGPDCSAFDDECAVGVCDAELDACVADTSVKDGAPCADGGECTVAGSGQCEDGQCVGAGTTLSPSCRWIICATSSTNPVNVYSGDGSEIDANSCGDTAKSGGNTTASIVTTANTGEAIFFYGDPTVGGDIVTGGASVGSNLYLTVPGTDMKDIAAGQTVAKDPAGEVNTTGLHALVDVCNDDQTALAAAVPVLDAMGDVAIEEGDDNGVKIKIGESYLIDVTGDGVAVVDMNGLRVGHGTTLTLKGNATDVVMLRIHGPLKFGYHSSLVLDGLLARNVLFYATGNRCRLSPSTVGQGTIFCSEANRFTIGVGVEWAGTFLGAQREVQVRSNAQLTHVAFTGF